MRLDVRTVSLAVLVVTMAFSFLRAASTQPSAEIAFWAWFGQHEAELYDFEKDRDRIFGELNQALAKVDGDLTFEFGPKREDGKREFIVSAGGLKRAFPKVETLVKAAPALERWAVVKFRPRRNPLHDLTFGTRSIKASDVRYRLFKDEKPDKVAILLFLPGYNEDDPKVKAEFDQMGYLFLDEALGEYDVEIRVGAIVIEGTKSPHAEKSYPLGKLASDVDAHFRDNK